jgi:anti-sigma B factor antagonist
MSFHVEPTIQNVAVIRTSGPLNMATASRFRELVTRIVGQDGRTRIAVDLAGTDFMDSTGLGALISGLKIARLAGGDLRIACPGSIAVLLRHRHTERIMHPAQYRMVPILSVPRIRTGVLN